MATIKDIAKQAQVSISTVSLALNGDPRVKNTTHDKILRIAEKMQYHPNLAAKTLPSGKTWSISVINPANNPTLSSGFYSQFLHGVHSIAKEAHYSVSVSLIDDDYESLTRMIDEHRTDGFIIMNPSYSIPIIEGVIEQNIPYVLLGKIHNKEYVSVDNDNIQIGYDATKALLNEDRKRILFLSGPKNMTFSQDRLLGYKQAHTEFQQEICEDLLVYCDGFSKSALAIVSNLLTKKKLEFDGIIAMSDALAVGALVALKAKGLVVPQDVGVIGMNDDDISEFTFPPLTSVNLNAYKLGENAAKLLLQSIEQSRKRVQMNQTRIIIPHTIAFRESTHRKDD